MGSMRLARVSERWRRYQEKSPFYRQVAADGEESVWREIAETYDQTCYPDDQKRLILSHLLPLVGQKASGIEIGPRPRHLHPAPCRKARQPDPYSNPPLP